MIFIIIQPIINFTPGGCLVRQNEISNEMRFFASSGSGNTGSFGVIEQYAYAAAYNVISAGNILYLIGFSGSTASMLIRGSATKTSGSFTNYFYNTAVSPRSTNNVHLNQKHISAYDREKDILYVIQDVDNTYTPGKIMVNYARNASTTASFLDSTMLGDISSSGDYFTIKDIALDSKNNFLYLLINNDPETYLLRGRLSVNSASIGPISLNTSYGYVQSEISGVVKESFNLANVSEWSHGGGLYQMKNMLLGTTTSRKIWNKRRFIN